MNGVVPVENWQARGRIFPRFKRYGPIKPTMRQENHFKGALLMYMLDTNTLIYFFKGMGQVDKNLFAHAPKDIFISSIVVYELQVGIEKSSNSHKREKQFAALLEQINVLAFAEQEARAAAYIRSALEKKGTPIGPIDVLIAGSAKAHDLTLVTHNTKEFERVEGLKLEDWF